MTTRRIAKATAFSFLLSAWAGCGHDQGRTDGESAPADGGEASGGGGGFGGEDTQSGGGSHPDDATGGSGESGGQPATGGLGNSGGRGGSGGSESTGGGGGTGGWSGCSALEGALCDDGNDCTLDECSEVGCRHEAVADDTPCDDRNACTASDSCSAGICTGEAIASEAAVQGERRTFASYIPYERAGRSGFLDAGLSLALSDELFVFTEPRRSTSGRLDLDLVRHVEGELRPVDHVATTQDIDSALAGFWPRMIGSHLVRLNDQRFALVRANELEIYDADLSGLALAARRDLYAEDGINSSLFWDAKAHDDRLWILDSLHDCIYVYQIAVDGTPTLLATVDLPRSSSAFAVKDDQHVVYAGGLHGVYRVDVSDLQNPVASAAPVIPAESETRPRQIEIRGDYLFIQAEEMWNHLGNARLYHLPDMALIREFPSTLVVDSPMGGAFTDDGFLLQRALYDNNEPSELRAELYSLDGAELSLVDSFLYADLSALEDHRLYRVFPPTASGNAAILRPFRRVVTSAGRSLSELTGPLQGTFDALQAEDDGSIVAFGAESSHRVALSDAGLSLIEGGMYPPGAGALFRLAFPDVARPSGIQTFPRLLGPTHLVESSGYLGWLSVPSNEHAEPEGVFPLPGAPFDSAAYQLASSSLFFRLEYFSDTRTNALSVFPLPTSTQDWTSLETVTSTVLPDFEYPSTFAVDFSGESFVVSSEGHDADQDVVLWYERAGSGYELASTLTLGPPRIYFGEAVLRGGTWIVLSADGRQLLHFSRDASGINQVALRELPGADSAAVEYHKLLGIEGDRLYVTGLFVEDGPPRIVLRGIDVLRLSDLSVVAHYPMSQEMTTFTTAGEDLVFAGPSSLVAATPECGGGTLVE